jgi:hypothetical protein
MTVENHPAAFYERDVSAIRGLAAWAVAALGATVALRAADIAVRAWQSGLVSDARAGDMPPRATLVLSDTLVQYTSIAILALLVLTGALFLRWLHRVVRLTHALGDESFTWSASDAVWGFIIPFVSFKRPYDVMRDLYRALAPDAVPEPTVEVRADETTGYRSVNMNVPPPARALPDASIGAWWTFFWIGNVAANIASRQSGTSLDDLLFQSHTQQFSSAVECISATLAIIVVRAVTARLAERYRRVRHSSIDALTAAGIRVS